MTTEQVKEIWFRDKAFDMQCPSIDRIDNDGDYAIDNCRFIERNENSRKGSKTLKELCSDD